MDMTLHWCRIFEEDDLSWSNILLIIVHAIFVNNLKQTLLCMDHNHANCASVRISNSLFWTDSKTLIKIMFIFKAILCVTFKISLLFQVCFTRENSRNFFPNRTLTDSKRQASRMDRHPTGSHFNMMTSSNGNIFRVTGPLCGEFTGHWWIPLTKACDAELWCFLRSAHE